MPLDAVAVAAPVTAPVDRTEIIRRARRVDVEATRIVAAAMVVIVHATTFFVATSQQAWSVTNGIALTAYMASRSAASVFFAVAGWALLTRREHPDEVAWLLRRLKRLLVPLLIWDVVYVFVAWVAAQSRGELVGGPTADWLTGQLRLSLTGPGTSGHLWFMYYLVPVTLTIWLIKVAPRAILDARTRTVFLCAVLGLMLPFGLATMVDVGLVAQDFGWALAYALLGYAVISVAPPRRWISAALFLGSTAGLVVAELMAGYAAWVISFPAPLLVAQTVGVIGLVRSVRIPERWNGPILKAASLTFGVYLVHVVFTEAFRITLYTWPVPHLISLLVSVTATLTLSFAVVAAWHRVPLLAKVLG